MTNTGSRPIEKIQAIINYAQYAAELHPLTPDGKGQHVLVGPGQYMTAPGQYSPDRLLVMDLAFLNDVLVCAGVEPNPKVDYLRYMMELPFQVSEEKHKDVFQLLSFFNLIVPMGCFCLHESGAPYFRYDHIVHATQEVEAFVVIEILNTLMFFIENLGYKIEQLASGQKSLEALLNEEIKFDNRPHMAENIS